LFPTIRNGAFDIFKYQLGFVEISDPHCPITYSMICWMLSQESCWVFFDHVYNHRCDILLSFPKEGLEIMRSFTISDEIKVKLSLLL
jgi:hypothetical protein